MLFLLQLVLMVLMLFLLQLVPTVLVLFLLLVLVVLMLFSPQLVPVSTPCDQPVMVQAAVPRHGLYGCPVIYKPCMVCQHDRALFIT